MMGRPIRYTPKEIETAVMRGRYMVSIAAEALGDFDAEVGHVPVKGIRRFIRKEPLGVVLTISGIATLFIASNS
jgi:acyl-CoA reductase-like NAD-dependent aldehyde dehydrogenase